MLGVILRRRDDCWRALLPPLTRDARKRGELARCPAPSSRARGLWDSLEAPTKRHEMFPAYRSGRAFDEELIEQLNVMPEFVAAFGFANAKAEADDFLVAAEERAGGTAIVASGDRDRLVKHDDPLPVEGWRPRERIGPEDVRRRYGVDPKQVPDFIALRGDPSDKLPGAPGVGPKRAAQFAATVRHA
jgi:DNA polymerase I